MSGTIDWMPVKNNWNKRIGAIGWIGDEPALVVPLYDVADEDKDGTVSNTELVMWKLNPFTTSTSALEVVENARGGYVSDLGSQVNANYRPARHSALKELRSQTWVSTGGSFIREAIWKCSLQRGVGSLGGALGGQLGKNMLTQTAIKKGTTSLVKAAFDQLFEEV